MWRNNVGVNHVLGAGLVLFGVQVCAQDRYQPEISAAQVRRMTDAREALRKGDVNRSIHALSQLVGEVPDYFLAHYNLGIAMSAKGDNAAALSAFQRALAIKEAKNIDEWSIYNSTGWAFMLIGETRKAEDLLKMAEQHADRLPPGSQAKLWNNLGYLYMSEGNFEKAKPYLDRAKSLGSALAEDNLRMMEQLSQAKKNRK